VVSGKSSFIPRRGKGPRIVICGGGWGGLSAARYLREWVPQADVILVDRNPTFWSGPMSNKWLADVVSTDFVNRDILRPARTWGYTLLQAEVMAFERDKRRVQTSMGWLDYDYLILAGGIRDAFDVWFGNDQRTIDYTRMHYSSAYLPNREMLSLKQRVHAFKGGTLVMTMPPMRMLDSLSTKRAEYHTQPAKMMKKASCPIQSVLSGLKPSATVVSRPPTKI